MEKGMKDEKMEFNKKLYDNKYSPRYPFSAVEYIPELDTSAECTKDQVNLFHTLIRLLH